MGKNLFDNISKHEQPSLKSNGVDTLASIRSPKS